MVNNDDLSQLNKLLEKNSYVHDGPEHEKDQCLDQKYSFGNDGYRRVIGTYKRQYSFEEFIDNLSKNQIRELRDSISDEKRKKYFSYFKNVNNKRDFYVLFDQLWDKITEDKLAKEDAINNNANDKLALIKTSIKVSLKYSLEWLNINGFLAKKIDNPIFEKMINESYVNLTDEYTRSIRNET